MSTMTFPKYRALGVALGVALSCLGALGQAPIQRNTFTTQINAGYTLTGTNASFPGQVAMDNGRITNSLKLLSLDADTVAVIGNLKNLNSLPNGGEGQVLGISNGVPAYLNVSGAAGTTNYFDTTLITNNFFVSGKGNSLVITQTLTVSGGFVYPLLPGTNITFVTNTLGAGLTNLTINASGGAGGSAVSVNGTNVSPANITNSASVTWAVSGSNITASASGAAAAFNLLSYSGTNVTVDCSLGGSEAAYYQLNLTNAAWFTVPSSVPTTPKGFQIWFQQPSTGGCVVQFTNASYKFPGGVVASVDTNNSAVTVATFATGPFTNGLLNFIGLTPQIQ